MQEEVIGIDFGTTNSGVAFLELDEPTIIANGEGERVTPSVVYFKEDGTVEVGSIAKRNIIASPERTVKSIKRYMGTDHRVEIGKESYPPEYIGAHIIKKLVHDAEKQIGTSFSDAVITVPAYFMDPQRQAVKDAGEIAGLNVRGILNEPTAAALAFGLRADEERRVLVYDFGGGTFDVSVLTIGGGFFDVDATSGDNHLGGDDIDARIVDFALDKIEEKHKIDLKKKKDKYRAVLQSLREEVERVKIELSSKESATINLPYAGTKRGAPIAFSYKLSRQEFNELIADFIVRTKKPMEQALGDASLSPEDIDDILLVGGTTYIPAVQEFVREFLGKEPVRDVNPIEVVALGAAVAAMKEDIKEKTGKIRRPVEISDVISRSLGVLTYDGTVAKIITRNTKIPINMTKGFTNPWDYMDEVEIGVYQGESTLPEEKGFLGEFFISIEPKPMDESKIDVTFEVGEEFGILTVTAKDHDSGNERTVKMEARGRLSKEEKNRWMDKMLKMHSTKVSVVNVETEDVLSYYLNPNVHIRDVKRELRRKGILAKGMSIFYKDNKLPDKQQIKEIGIKDGSELEIRRKE
jgi:molecular chaperone DnaK